MRCPCVGREGWRAHLEVVCEGLAGTAFVDTLGEEGFEAYAEGPAVVWTRSGNVGMSGRRWAVSSRSRALGPSWGE